ncbi:hypothetical protein FOL47_008576 [Perkinsus chesapeaki]|uniref:Uncharacterized protein n=1 Tax=Perkinsus chesapeaki TaxID=330153 RepID=A0A7J6LD90_PERCH|nr:hypothetical protein FOL47_008576 [Perkinsus chesapeaki]
MSTTAAAAAAGGGGVEGTHTTIDNATTTTSIIHNNNNNNQEQEDDNKGNSSSITDQANHEVKLLLRGDTLKVYNTAIVLEEDEMSSGRRIIIHVDIPSILHRSRRGKEQQQYSTDIIVNRWLASMAWGRIDDTTGDWILAVDKISINPPIDENQSSSCNSEHHQQQQDTQQYTTDGVGGEGELANSILITYLEYLENKYIRERGYDNEEEDDDGEVEEVDKE